MNIRGTIIVGAMALTAMAQILPRSASADCLEGTRKTSGAEKAKHKQITAVLDDAFTAPEGWKKSGERPHRTPGSVCKDSTGGQLHASYKISFMEMGGAEGRQDKMKAEMMALAEAGPGDREQMRAKMAAIQNMSRNLSHDTIIEVEVRINKSGVLDPGLPITVPGNYPAFQKPQPGELADQRKTTVLLGPWKKNEEGHHKALMKKGAPVEALQTAVVTVKASEARTQTFLASSKLASIAALLDK